jgi:hypothetical protein
MRDFVKYPLRLSVAPIENDIGRNAADESTDECPTHTLGEETKNKRTNKSEDDKGYRIDHEPQHGRRNGEAYPDHDADENPVHGDPSRCGRKIASPVTFDEIA